MTAGSDGTPPHNPLDGVDAPSIEGQEAAEERLYNDFHRTFTSEHGKRVLRYIKVSCGADPVAPICGDPQGVTGTDFAYFVGRQWVPFMIEDMILRHLEKVGDTP